MIEPPVANSGIAGGACVIAVAAPATMNDPRVSRDREAPVEKQRKEEGRGERRQTSGTRSVPFIHIYIYTNGEAIFGAHPMSSLRLNARQ